MARLASMIFAVTLTWSLAFLPYQLHAGLDGFEKIRLKNCPFEALMPSNYKIQKMSVPINGEILNWERAEAITDSEFLRHECIRSPQPLSEVVNDDYMKQRLAMAVSSYGFVLTEMKTLDFSQGHAIEGLGIKTVKGRQGMIKTRIYIYGDFIAEFSAGTQANIFPTVNISNFFKSINIKSY